MKTYIADIIPKIQKFSQKLDNLTRLTNQHWVSLGDIDQTKRVFIFRSNNELIISNNGIVERGSWEYLGNQTLLINTKEVSYLLKHGFFDENVIALKLDSTDSYAFFVNETKYIKELNNISDILKFLENKYLKTQPTSSGIGSTSQKEYFDNATYSYKIISEKESFNIFWGNYITYCIEYSTGQSGVIYKGSSSNKYFYMDNTFGKQYYITLDEVVHKLYLHMREKSKP